MARLMIVGVHDIISDKILISKMIYMTKEVSTFFFIIARWQIIPKL